MIEQYDDDRGTPEARAWLPVALADLRWLQRAPTSPRPVGLRRPFWATDVFVSDLPSVARFSRTIARFRAAVAVAINDALSLALDAIDAIDAAMVPADASERAAFLDRHARAVDATA
jgi:hypothetical protein